jgi:hypothetical protein
MITQMQVRYKDFTDQRVLMNKRIQGAITRRTLLDEDVRAASGKGVGGAVRRASRGGQPGPARTPVPGQRDYAKGEGQANGANKASGGDGNLRPGDGPSMRRTRPTSAPPSDTGAATAAPSGHQHPPETSTRSSQNVLLGLGALLFAVAAVVLTGYLLPAIGAGARALIFLVLTALALAAPQWLVRVKLIATAETIASVGLVFVLLDGYNVWSAGWLAHSGLTAAGYAGLVCLGASGVAAVYRAQTHLVTPRFAAVLLVQPVMPLLGFSLIHGISAWATVFSAVAAADLALALVLTGPEEHGQGWVGLIHARLPQPLLTKRTPYLIDAVWALHALGVLVGTGCAVIALGVADTGTEVLGGAAALLIAAVVGMGGGLLLRRPPLPDVGIALATLAVIGAAGRVTAVVAPGRGLFAAAAATLATAVALYLLGIVGPDAARSTKLVAGRRGAHWAGLLASATVGVLVLLRGLPGILAPIRAAVPYWYADLDRYPGRLADAVGPHGAQLCLAAVLLAGTAIMFPPADRGDVVTAFGGLAVLLAPAGLGMPWALAPVLTTVAALVAGGYALTATRARSAWIRSGTALVVGLSGAGIALARPGAAGLCLTFLAIGGAVIGSAPRLPAVALPARITLRLDQTGGRSEHDRARARAIAGDLALGGAAFALPGAVACGTAALGTVVAGPRPIIAATFLAVTGTLVATALTQVAWDRGERRSDIAPPSRLIALGTLLGATVLASAALRTHVGLIDRAVAVLLLVAAATLLFEPWLFPGRTGGGPAGTPDKEPRFGSSDERDAGTPVLGRLRGPDVSAVVVTTAAIAAVTRVGALIVPRYGLASAAIVVLAVAIGIRSIPVTWRRGPIVGTAAVSTIVGLIAGVTAIRAGIAVIEATRPVWHTDLAHWSATVPGDYAQQVPLTLLVLAVAAAVGLPRPWSQQGVAIGVGLAALAAPAALGLPWWSPIMLSGACAATFGILAGATRDPRVAWVRFGVATVLFADTVAASLVAPQTTTTTLFASALVNAAIAGTAMVTRRRIDVVRLPPQHLTLIGGGALATAVLLVPGGFACLAATRHAPPAMVLTAALAGLCVAFAIAALACSDDAPMLLHVTVAVAAGGTTIAVGTLRAGLPVEVYAAAATLLVVLSELMRTAVLDKRATRVRLRPRASDQMLAAAPRPGYTVFFAAGPATVLAVVWLAPRVLAALFGPYQQINDVWPAHPPTTAQQGLGHLAHWAGDGNSVVAALLLTIAAALGAVGLSGGGPGRSPRTGFAGRPAYGSRTPTEPVRRRELSAAGPVDPVRQLTERAVAVVIPGIAITLLIAPAALRLGWAAQPLAALLVAALCGLGVALTMPPQRVESPLRDARRIVVLICVLAAAAGLSGALATQAMTLTSLSITTACGLVAGLRGASRTARVSGWLVAGVAGHLLALVIGRVADLPVYQSAFLVAAVAAGLLLLAALLPRLQEQANLSESITVEATAYAGAVFALLLASRSQPYLAVFCTAWGVVLAVAAARPQRSALYRRTLIWFAVAHEVAAWWLLMHLRGVHVVEAYSLAVAVGALVIGWLETRNRPDLSSWSAYGVALVAAFLPTIALLFNGGEPSVWRRVLLIVGAAATVAVGSLSRQEAPIAVGGVALVIAALYEVWVLSTAVLLGVVLAIVAVAMVALGAGTEQRRKRSEQLRGARAKLR